MKSSDSLHRKGINIPHFTEPGRIELSDQQKRLPADIYGRALDSIVIACVDIVFMHNQQIFLGKRNTYPRNSWWVIGGRMFPGERPEESVRRKALEEAGINIDNYQLICFGVYSTCFSMRAQDPQKHGTHSVNLTYKLEITEIEKKQLSLNGLKRSEYEDWNWFHLKEVENLLDLDNVLDQSLLRVVKDLQLTLELEKV